MSVEVGDPRQLLGSWRLRRTVDDRLAGEVVGAEGTLLLTDEGDGRLRWSESGWLRRTQGDLEFFRVLFLVEVAPGWDVTFDDGRPFHPWRPGEWVEHPCAADVYRGLVASEGDQGWRVQWRVRGPRKDYSMSTHLER